MKTIRYLILVGISVALFNLSNALRSNLESPSNLNGGVYNNVEELSNDGNNKYSEQRRYIGPNRTNNDLDKPHFQNKINTFLDKTNSGKVRNDNESYNNATANADEVLLESVENPSPAYAKLIELSGLESSKSYRMNDKSDIKGRIDKEKKKEKTKSIRIKSTKNFNDRESVRIKKFETKNIKNKDINFLEHSKEDLLSSDLIGTHFVMENAFENAFEDSVNANAKENSSSSVDNSYTNSAELANKKIKKSNENKYAGHVSFLETSKKHTKSNHNKQGKRKHTQRKNDSKSHDKSNHKNNVNKKHAKHKTTNNINESNTIANGKSQVQTRSKSDNIQEDYDEETEEETSDTVSDVHDTNDDNEETDELLDNRKEVSTHTSTDNNDDDDDDEGNNNLMIKHEMDAIKKYSKIYKLNIFNCSLINDWDFAHQYVEEKGSLVKLSGYVFQNTQDTDAMPASNNDDWKLKGACDFRKYICGALSFMPNQYHKGERVIFGDRIYETLMNTELSPQDDPSSWVDKTNECEETLIN